MGTKTMLFGSGPQVLFSLVSLPYIRPTINSFAQNLANWGFRAKNKGTERKSYGKIILFSNTLQPFYTFSHFDLLLTIPPLKKKGNSHGYGNEQWQKRRSDGQTDTVTILSRFNATKKMKSLSACERKQLIRQNTPFAKTAEMKVVKGDGR